MDSTDERNTHEKTYGSFIDLLKWTVPAAAIIALVVVVLISS